MTTTAPPKAGRREWVGLAVLTLACLVYAMDLTVLHLAVPAISADLAPSSAQLLWIIDIYGFMAAGFLITMGTLGDRIGRRRLLVAGSAAFGVVSLLAAFSPTSELLIGSRALLGIVAATLAPSTLSLIFVMFQDLRQRSIAIGVWIGAFSAGSAVGPVLGGVLLEYFWWGSVFLLAVPAMVLLVVLGPIMLPEYRAPDAGRLDLVSAGLSLAAVLTVIFGVKQLAQNGAGWLPAVSIAAGLLLATVFVRRQLTLADPMIDLRLLRIPAFSAGLVVNVLAIFVVFGYMMFVAQYLQLVLGFSPLLAGMWSVPAAAAFVLGSQLGPRIVAVVRPAYVMGAGLAVAAAGLVVLTQAPTSGSSAMVVTASVVIALGLAPVLGLTTELIVESAPPERAGAASGIAETGSELGGALGISVLGSIGVAVYRNDLTSSLPAEVPAPVAAGVLDTLGAAVTSAATLPGQLGATVVELAREGFVHGMRVAVLIATVMTLAVAVIAVLTLRHVPPGTRPDSDPEPAADPAAVAPGSPGPHPTGPATDLVGADARQ